ncbi:Receptor-like kinase, putative [Arachis hypogaea]|nr:Receptor-like kinase, putative [Arachis hypogaea]
MPKLVEVNLEGNSIEGSIPDLSNSTSLQYLLLANNRLTGVVPPFLGLLNNISQVSLENNWLQGPLPAFNKSRAPKLNFTSNGFCLDHPGPCDHRVITLLQVAQTLYYPFLLAQSWRGNNPCQDWNFITCDDKGNIRTVNLTNLNLTGTISLSFKNLTVLEGLYLGGNRLNGSILDILTSLRQLKILDVSNNNLSGSLPPFSKKKTIVITTGNAFLQQSHSPKTSLSSTFIIGISAGVGVIVMIFVAIFYYCKRHFSRIMLNKETSLVRQFGEQINNATLVRYTYAEVEQMTKSFQEELGKGGFGIVYKGSLNDGCQLAVKILKEMKGSAEKFVNEVVTISRTSHVNIVSLLEFCYEMNKQALIYEFMSKGSLDKYKCKEGSSELDWKTLLQIVTGVAQGLDYLHRGCNTRILHFDIKPQNMLLDEKFCPKIADFGLARICKKDESVVSILDRRGISGYISPEMFSQRNGRVSHKSDVYSYGMLILEMIGGNDNYDIGESHSTEYFSDWILKDIKEDKIRLLRFASGKDDEDIIKKILFVGLWCIQMNPSDRPKMCKVVEMLQGKLESISLESIISSPTVPLLQHSDASHS